MKGIENAIEETEIEGGPEVDLRREGRTIEEGEKMMREREKSQDLVAAVVKDIAPKIKKDHLCMYFMFNFFFNYPKAFFIHLCKVFEYNLFLT